MTNVLISKIEGILGFLEPFSSFINCHMVNYLTDNHWEQFIPPGVRDELKSNFEIEEAIKEVFWEDKSSTKFKNLQEFIKTCRINYLENSEITSSAEEVLESLSKEQNSKDDLYIKEFMSAKKCHEVEIASRFINDILSSMEVDCIIDAGDGKGYLSSRLALQYKRTVLGVDSSSSNTENALDRKQKLEKAWNGLTLRANLVSQGITPPRRGKKEKIVCPSANTCDTYKTCNEFITEKVNFQKLAGEAFNDHFETFCMTGLHTCGNLASTCLKVYEAQYDFKVLCNVGCCYHLINEEFSKDEFFGNKVLNTLNTDFGFPMSGFLKDKKVCLGRNARMLAAQSVHRTLDKKEFPDKSLFYRALLEVLIVEMDESLKDTVQVGKIKKEGGFLDYVRKCDKKRNLELFTHFTEEQILEIEKIYSQKEMTLNAFYLIRMSFAPVIEALILLDRLLFLRENGQNQSWLVSLFDPVISPRCYCLVGIKGC
ncbi:METTL25 family protein [Megaselia abdita]